MGLLSGGLEHGLRVTLAVIVRILAPGIADLAEDADDLLALVGLGNLDERLAERLAEILVGHEVGVLAVGDHVIVDALGHTDDARLLDHGGRAAELLLPDGRVLDADMAIGDHHVSLTGGQTRERRAVRVGLHHVIQIGNGLAIVLLQPEARVDVAGRGRRGEHGPGRAVEIVPRQLLAGVDLLEQLLPLRARAGQNDRAVIGRHVLYFEHSIVAVCRRRDFDPDYEKSYAALDDLLKRLSLKVYISTRFFRFTELSMAYGQCRLMKSYPLEPQKHIQRFDEAFLHVLYGVLKEKNSLPGFCHPAVLSLWQSHMEQDLTLIHNLKCYLINGRNIAETARTLHLHRNTLIYRLRKIEDLLHISLDYLDENMLLYLLISCLICETL